MVKVIIDGKTAEVEKEITILQAAQKVGIEIPTLCYMHLHETTMKNQPASCRICVVEVEGRRNLAPACATPVIDGMVIHTHSMRVIQARKTIMSLMLSDHPKDCLGCIKAEDCELLEMAQKLGIREKDQLQESAKSTYPQDLGVALNRDMDKCILCRRCETMCQTVQTVGALSAINRGFEAVVSPAFEMELSEKKKELIKVESHLRNKMNSYGIY